MINVAIMGHGVVGSGVAEILINYKDRVSSKAKDEINVKYILLRVHKVIIKNQTGKYQYRQCKQNF